MLADDELIRTILRTIDAAAWNALEKLVTPDIVYDRPGYPTLRGVAAFINFYTHTRVVATGQHRLDSVLTDGRTGFCWGHFAGVTRDGQPISEVFADWYQFDSGRVSRRRTFFFRPAI